MAVYNKVGFIDKNTILKKIIDRTITTLTANNLYGLTEIGDNAFYQCTSLTSVEMPNTVTNIGIYAFSNCTNLTTLTLSEGLTSIENFAFYRSNITTMTLPEGLISIGEYAFSGSLTNVTIPSTVTTMGWNAFSNCTLITTVTMLPTTPPSGGEYWFSSRSLTAIYVPANSVNAYKNATGWSAYASYIQAIPE